MPKLERHNDWLCVAEDDLKAAKKLTSGTDIHLAPAIFHTQQCMEKALKAYLVFKEQPLKRIHDLVILVNSCKRFDPQFDQFLEDAIYLNPFLAKSRYPDDYLMIPDLTTVNEAIKRTEKVLNFVKEKIKHQ
jgi:HEPN domain-containing protein